MAPAVNTIGFEQTIQLTPLQSPQGSPKENDGALTIQQKPITGVIYEPPALKTPGDLAGMPSLQALHILRLQLKTSSILGDATPVALLPTALQRVIPHDIRIDYIPGAAIRDRLILFQDYYNADECFQALIQSTIFIGGDVRDAQNWKSDPSYSMKFWFVSHHLFDQSLEDYLDLKTVTSILEDYYSNDREDKSSKQTVSSQDSPSTPSSAQSEKSTPILLQPDICYSTTSL
ncbi:hypothetical protein K501DRAFT_194659 [Backusella circina FSU 941]|nr:hypothetical protein K501DRAFT_194659 [Backusella circina FSU 941]